MIKSVSIEFWIATLFFINFFLVMFTFFMVRKLNRMNGEILEQASGANGSVDSDYAKMSASEIVNMLEPLVEESQKAAISFEQQVTEKKRLLKELNDALDSRVISINLLLSRADAQQKKIEASQRDALTSFSTPRNHDFNLSSTPILDQQNQIIEMYRNKTDVDTIARHLSIPKGEVQLVIDLKKKFLAMEKDNR